MGLLTCATSFCFPFSLLVSLKTEIHLSRVIPTSRSHSSTKSGNLGRYPPRQRRERGRRRAASGSRCDSVAELVTRCLVVTNPCPLVETGPAGLAAAAAQAWSLVPRWRWRGVFH